VPASSGALAPPLVKYPVSFGIINRVENFADGLLNFRLHLKF